MSKYKTPRGHEKQARDGFKDGLDNRPSREDDVRSTRKKTYRENYKEGQKKREDIHRPGRT